MQALPVDCLNQEAGIMLIVVDCLSNVVKVVAVDTGKQVLAEPEAKMQISNQPRKPQLAES
jgi:hypothetical protein